MWDGVWASGLTEGAVAFAVETKMLKGTRSLCKLLLVPQEKVFYEMVQCRWYSN